MKVKAYTTTNKSVGNVIPNTVEIIDAQAVQERADYYEVVINPNRIRTYTKKYWRVETVR